MKRTLTTIVILLAAAVSFAQSVPVKKSLSKGRKATAIEKTKVEKTAPSAVQEAHACQASQCRMRASVADTVKCVKCEAVAEQETKTAVVQAVPDVPLDKLFEALIAPHKGKVVVIDFWNTWCGPCRMALRANEPHKSTDLSSPDIVWIYIANETSPIGVYTQMIPDIKGLHYRLTKEQWMQLTGKVFPEIDGIPAYAFVKRDGTYALRLDFRDHSVMTQTILEEVGKKD